MKLRKKDLHFTLMRLRDRINHWGCEINDNRQETKNILRTLKLHGEGHMANDLTPQFTKLCERVDAGFLTISAQNARIRELEDRQNLTRDHVKVLENRTASHDHPLPARISNIEESIEGLSETVDQLSSTGPHTCHNHAALKEDRQRIIELEEAINTHLMTVADVEILKTQMAGLENSNRILTMEAFAWRETNTDVEAVKTRLAELKKRYDMMESADCANLEQLRKRTLVRDVDTLKIQQSNTSPRLKALMDAVIEQREYLMKVETTIQKQLAEMQMGVMEHKIIENKSCNSCIYLPFGSDEGDGKTPSFREGMKSSLIVMY